MKRGQGQPSQKRHSAAGCQCLPSDLPERSGSWPVTSYTVVVTTSISPCVIDVYVDTHELSSYRAASLDVCSYIGLDLVDYTFQHATLMVLIA